MEDRDSNRQRVGMASYGEGKKVGVGREGWKYRLGEKVRHCQTSFSAL